MIYPNLTEEKKLWKRGYKWIAGIDEAGRGALAGPVFVGVVIINQNLNFPSNFRHLLKTVKDSKKLSIKKREEVYKLLIKEENINWAVSKVSEKVIDKINIKKATEIAIKKALGKIKKEKLKIDYLILDGNIKLNLQIPQKSIIKADEKVFSCAAASIIAKVSRDRFMKRIHKKYPSYNFANHKGYGTEFHLKMLKKYGPCQIHRQSFKPIKDFNSKI